MAAKRKSEFFGFNVGDVIRGLIVAIFAGGLVALKTWLDSGLAWTPENWRVIAMAAAAGGVGYILKNFLTTEDGDFLGIRKL